MVEQNANNRSEASTKRRSSLGVTFAWLLLWAVVAVGGVFAIRQRVTGGDEGIRRRAAAHEAAVAHLNDEFNEIASQQRQTRFLLRRTHAERRVLELESALGGPARAAFANPEFTILEAMDKALRTCAPSNSQAEVRVDRFTEFTATISTFQALSTNEMIGVARAFVPLARDYLEALRFSAKGEVVAELDRQDIELVENWATVPDARLAMLLAREIPGSVAADPKAVEKYQEQQRLNAALADEGVRAKAAVVDREFREAAQKGFDDLKAAIDLSHKGITTFDIKSLGDVDAREKTLREATEHAERAKAFWLAPQKIWEGSMDAQGLSDDARDALANILLTSFRNDAAKTKTLFAALDGLMVTGRYLLRTLSENSDKWRYSIDDGGLSFRDAAVGAQVSRIREQLRVDLRAADEALRAWQERVAE